VKLYHYRYNGRYNITDDANESYTASWVYTNSQYTSSYMEQLDIPIEIWWSFAQKHNADCNPRGNTMWDLTFKREDDAKNFIRELDPYIILSELGEYEWN
jgi:hypothetical protein